MLLLRVRNDRRQSIRFRLAGLVAACVLPVCLVGGFLVYNAYEYKRSLIEQHMLETARALTLTVDRELANIQSALLVLATSPHLAAGDLAGFHSQAREVLHEFPGADIILADGTAQQFVNTYRRFGEPLPKRNTPEVVRRIFDTGQPVISNLFFGAVTKRPLIGVDVPVFAGDKVVYDLAATVPADRLAAILSQQRLNPGWVGSILDGNRTVVGRTLNPERFVGQSVASALVRRMNESNEGAIGVDSVEGIPIFAAFSQSQVSGWTVVIGVPAATVRAEIRQWLWWVVVGLIALAAACALLASLMARSIGRSIQALVVPALALGRGEAVGPMRLDLVETSAVGEALVKASDLLAKRAEERDRAEQALVEHSQMLQHQYDNLRSLNDIAALPEAEAGQRLTEALSLGLRHFGLTCGVISQVEGGRYTVRHQCSPPEAGLSNGMVFDLGATYCALTLETNQVVAISHMALSPFAGHPCYRALGLERYIGAPIMAHGRIYGTVDFSASTTGMRAFDEGDREFMRWLARWIGAVLERQSTYEELARSNAELEQFAYVASHDLREPLRQVSSFVTLLERRYNDTLDDEGREFIGFARDGAKRMDNLILDLLDYSRIGRHERPHAQVDLAAVLDYGIANLRVAIDEAGARVRVVGDMPMVIGDQTELVRLFQNLISNAIKYRAATRPPQITLSACNDAQFCVVTVEDNGIGIASEHFERIFRIFQRLHGRGQYDGTGIGLASCKKIAEHHGGRIWVDSEPDRGSRFHVALPAVAVVRMV